MIFAMRSSILAPFARLSALTALALATGGCAGRAFYGESAIDGELASAAARYDQAQIHGDRAALEELVADDYLCVGHDGSVDGKKGLVDEFAHPGMRVAPFVVEKKLVRDYGSTVILGGWTTLTGSDNGHAFSLRVRFIDVWTRRHGRWQVAFTQLTNRDAP